MGEAPQVRDLLDEDRRRGERQIGWIRLLFLGALAVADVVFLVFILESPPSISEIIDIAVLGGGTGITVTILVLLRRGVYSRALVRAFSLLDCALLTAAIYGVRFAPENTTSVRIAYSALFVLYFVLLIASLSRRDPLNTLSIGMASGLFYGAVVVVMWRDGAFAALYVSDAGLSFQPRIFYEVFKSLSLVMAGIVGFAVTRNTSALFLRSLQIESALSESESKFRLLAEQSGLAIVIVQDDIVRYANDAYAAALETSVEGVIGGPRGEHTRVLGEPVEVGGGDVRRTVHRVMTSQGTPRWLERYSKPISYQGRPASLETLIDSTHRKQLEAQLKQAARLESIGRLSGGIVHDFNNLLTAILGFSEVLCQGGRLENTDAGFVEEISRSAQRAVGLTRQLLSFSRARTAQPQALDLNDTVRDLERMLRRLIGTRFPLVTALCSGPLTVWADQGQIEQVIMNLVLNARDAMSDGGEIRITTSGEGEGRTARVSVADAGSGMAEATIQRIYEPFFTTKEEGQGTGLGHHIARQTVESHEGSIAVRSEIGVGTTFTVDLPVQREAQEAQGAPSEVAEATSGRGDDPGGGGGSGAPAGDDPDAPGHQP